MCLSSWFLFDCLKTVHLGNSTDTIQDYIRQKAGNTWDHHVNIMLVHDWWMGQVDLHNSCHLHHMVDELTQVSQVKIFIHTIYNRYKNRQYTKCVNPFLTSCFEDEIVLPRNTRLCGLCCTYTEGKTYKLESILKTCFLESQTSFRLTLWSYIWLRVKMFWP